MNSKAIRKQLLAAVAMVLVAAVALGSSTYAWFVASGTVKAEGMKVQAQSEAGLVIRYDTGAWSTTATAGMTDSTKVALKPTSTIDAKEWYHASAATSSEFGANNATRTTVSSSNYDSYFLMKEFQIRSWSSTALAQGLYVKSVEVTGAGDKTMNTALRVGVRFYADDDMNTSLKGKTERFVIFAPVVAGAGENNEPTYTYTVYKSSSDAGTSVTALAANAGTATNAKLLDGDVEIPGTVSDCVRVQIYIWYEGEDHNLYTLNYNDNILSVAVNFASIYDESNPAPTSP